MYAIRTPLTRRHLPHHPLPPAAQCLKAIMRPSGSAGREWSGCSICIGLQPCLLPTAFISFVHLRSASVASSATDVCCCPFSRGGGPLKTGRADFPEASLPSPFHRMIHGKSEHPGWRYGTRSKEETMKANNGSAKKYRQGLFPVSCISSGCLIWSEFARQTIRAIQTLMFKQSSRSCRGQKVFPPFFQRLRQTADCHNQNEVSMVNTKYGQVLGPMPG